MPSPINDVLDQIAADWVATTPPDRATRSPYWYATDEDVDPEGQLSHRAFWFEPPQRGEPEAETDDSTLVRYECQVVLVLDADGYTPGAFRAVIADEQALLARVVEARTTWPAGTWEVITRGGEVTPLENSTVVLVTFNVTALVGED